MVVIPKQQPVLENLNIYYLNVRKLLEHFQGEIGTGGVYFKSHRAEGAIFFDQNELLSGLFKDRDIEISGDQAIERLLEAGGDYNFSVNIYEIGPEEVYYWASIPSAEQIYKDLSTEFTDLERLIKKMGSEKLTGYIDVSIGNGKEIGLIFLINGKIMGGSYSWSNGSPSPSKKNQDLLIQKTKEFGGSFNVCRIPLTNSKTARERELAKSNHPETAIAFLQELLVIFEKVVHLKRKKRTDFQKLLKRKLVEHADQYAFLDPFAGEFEHVDNKITFSGQASDQNLVAGVFVVVKEMAHELDLLSALIANLDSWSEKYSEELATYDITF
jgi:predicted HTH domain antitoxin